jgi:hypothetical protein
MHSESHPAHAPKEVETKHATSQPDRLPNSPVDPLTGQLSDQSTNQSTDQSTEQPTNQSLTQSTSHPSLLIATRQILNRPASFYLYEDQSEDLDNLVNLLKKEYKLKADRSALLRAILSEPVLDYHNRETHRTLVDRLIQQLTSRLISQ